MQLAPQDWYTQQSATQGFSPDAGQRRAVQHLQRLWDELLEFKAFRQRPFMKTFGWRAPPRGLYLYGGVGRGKSMLMDAFYRNIPLRRKRRVHFHAFMQDVHRSLTALKHESDPLVSVAAQVCRETRLLCFDEFHVSDIADAMILARLFEGLIEGGVVCFMTSNYAPRELYPNGLQRERFLPAIELLNARLDVVSIEAGPDFRLRTLENLDLYLHPLSAAAEQRMTAAFESVAGAAGQRKTLRVNDRDLIARKHGPGIAWFDFTELCATPRSQNDYLELARSFHTIFVSGVPAMNAELASEARRFTWLIDILYDHRVKLMLSAAVPADQLYTKGHHAGEFSRTVSRLLEMRSREYLSLAHVS